ncbi:MAG: hypothetical protein ACOYMP_09940 [Nodosilinea sp.]
MKADRPQTGIERLFPTTKAAVISLTTPCQRFIEETVAIINDGNFQPKTG